MTWPSNRFLWAVIEPSAAGAIGWKCDGELPAGLLPEIADQMPTEIDDLHAVGSADEDGRLIVCLASRDELMTLKPDAAVRSLTPAAIPTELGASASIDPGRFNLLVGPFEPICVRRARERRHLSAAAAVLIAAGLTSLGYWRRENAAQETLRTTDSASERVLTELGFKEDGSSMLTAELHQRRRFAGIDLDSHRPPDAAAALNLILASWPAESPGKLQTISLGPDGAVLSVLVPPPGDPALLLSSLKPIDGWTLDEPRLVAVGSDTRLTLRMRPKPPGAATSLTAGGRR